MPRITPAVVTCTGCGQAMQNASPDVAPSSAPPPPQFVRAPSSALRPVEPDAGDPSFSLADLESEDEAQAQAPFRRPGLGKPIRIAAVAACAVLAAGFAIAAVRKGRSASPPAANASAATDSQPPSPNPSSGNVGAPKRPEKPPPGQPARKWPQLRVGSKAPEIDLGKWWIGRGKSKLAEYRGDYVVLHFLAPTCDACQNTVLALNRLRDQYSGSGVHVLGIARVAERERPWRIPARAGKSGAAVKTGDTPLAMSDFVRDTRPRYPVAADTNGATLSKYHVAPRETEWRLLDSGRIQWKGHTLRDAQGRTCFLVGPKGRILWMGDGSDEKLLNLLDARLETAN